jgi:hypothetical protein
MAARAKPSQPDLYRSRSIRSYSRYGQPRMTSRILFRSRPRLGMCCDLSRSSASGLAKLGVPFQVTEQCLHRMSGVSKEALVRIYEQHDCAPEVKAAFENWSAPVEPLVVEMQTSAAQTIIEVARSRAALLAHFCSGSPHGRLTNLAGSFPHRS